MASHGLDIPQITVVDIQDVTNSRPLDTPSFPTSGLPVRHLQSHSGTVHHHFLPLPSLVLTIDRIHLAVLDCPSSRTSDASSSYPPSLAQCAHLLDSVVSRDHKNPEKVHDGLSSSGFLAPGEHTLPVLNVSTDSDVNGSASLGFPSPVASFLNRDRIVRYVYYPSPSHCGGTCMGSDDAI